MLILWGPQCSRLHFYLRNLKECRIQSVIIINMNSFFIPLLVFSSVFFFSLLFSLCQHTTAVCVFFMCTSFMHTFIILAGYHKWPAKIMQIIVAVNKKKAALLKSLKETMS